jgi:hypothetical protein
MFSFFNQLTYSGDGGAIYVEALGDRDFTLSSTSFLRCYASNGGACYVVAKLITQTAVGARSCFSALKGQYMYAVGTDGSKFIWTQTTLLLCGSGGRDTEGTMYLSPGKPDFEGINYTSCFVGGHGSALFSSQADTQALLWLYGFFMWCRGDSLVASGVAGSRQFKFCEFYGNEVRSGLFHLPGTGNVAEWQNCIFADNDGAFFTPSTVSGGTIKIENSVLSGECPANASCQGIHSDATTATYDRSILDTAICPTGNFDETNPTPWPDSLVSESEAESLASPSSPIAASEDLPRSVIFTQSVALQWSSLLPDSLQFAASDSLLPSSQFSLSQQFGDSNAFTETGCFGETDILTLSDAITSSEKLPVSLLLPVSDLFADSSVMSASTLLSESESLIPSSELSNSDSLIASDHFVQSDPLTASDELTTSDKLAASERLIASDELADSDKHIVSDSHISTRQFTGSGLLSPSGEFSDSDEISASERIAPSNVLLHSNPLPDSAPLPSSDHFSHSPAFSPTNVLSNSDLMAASRIHLDSGTFAPSMTSIPPMTSFLPIIPGITTESPTLKADPNQNGNGSPPPEKSNLGLILGIVFGVLAVVILIVVGFVVYRRSHRRDTDEGEEEPVLTTDGWDGTAEFSRRMQHEKEEEMTVDFNNPMFDAVDVSAHSDDQFAEDANEML